ncbi:hypothetical protein GCM10022248_48070 [Nonomuraea soli]
MIRPQVSATVTADPHRLSHPGAEGTRSKAQRATDRRSSRSPTGHACARRASGLSDSARREEPLSRQEAPAMVADPMTVSPEYSTAA